VEAAIRASYPKLAKSASGAGVTRSQKRPSSRHVSQSQRKR